MDIKSWLQTVLLQYYNDPDRTFRDVDAALQMHINSLKPQLNTYTYNDGHSQLLLCLHGTLPITYRSSPYNIPVAFWIPTEYPQCAPIPYVQPTANMLVRASQYVDQSGLCYHPYRSQWKEDVNSHNLLELITIFQHVFSNEPPVYTKISSNPSSAIGSPSKEHAMVKPLSSIPPPPPPPPPLGSSGVTGTPVSSAMDPASSAWHESTAFYNLSQDMQGMTMSPGGYSNSNSASHPVAANATSSSATTAPNTPTTAAAAAAAAAANHSAGSGSPYLSKSSSLPVIANNYPSAAVEESPQERLSRKVTERMQAFQLEISKEMDELLNVNRQLNDGEVQLQNEIHMLQDVRDRLQTNMSILESRSKDLEQITEQVNGLPDVSVDEALSGTTVVYNQLFELVADDNAVVDTIYYLGKALNTECIDLATFMKYTRKLAREQFMKRALIKKITESS